VSGTLHTSDARRAQHEAVLRRFEDAWRSGSRPDLRDFLGAGRPPTDLLLELVCTDLEYCYKNGHAPRAEDYFSQHPELRGDAAAVREIAALEVELRRRFNQAEGEVTLAPSGPPQATRSPPLPDDLPNYRILSELGRGGMGVVYKARQIRLQRFVALKMILAGEYAGPDASVRFLAEAEVTARLQHPNIVQIHDLGTHAGRPFLALEYVDGPSLGQVIDGTPQDPRLAAKLLHTLALAVAHAHDRGVIHRDLKPANILIADCGLGIADSVVGLQSAISNPKSTIKIADFGLARHGDGGMTQSGAVVGTPSYMAPEQAAAKRTAVGPAVDIYALGAILYELLTGRPPFRGTTAWETVEQVQTQEPVPPTRLQPRLPRDLETICLKCLDKNPVARYATAEALADDLDRFLKHEPIRARRIGVLERGLRWCRREPRTAGLLAAALVILLLGIGVTLTLLRQGSQQEEAYFEELLADVEHGLTFAGREELALVPQLDDNLRKFLERLAERCRRLVAQRRGDARLQRRVAEVQHQVGVIYQLLGRHDDAESAFLTARAARAELATGANHTRQDDLALALSNYELGGLYVAIGRLQEADQCLAQALALQVLVDDGDADPASAQRAATLHRLAGLQLSVGKLTEGEKSYRAALLLRQQLLDTKPDATDATLDLAQTEAGLAEHLTLLGQLAEADQLYASAIKRLAASAGAPGMRLALARCLLGQGRMAEVRDDRKSASAAYPARRRDPEAARRGSSAASRLSAGNGRGGSQPRALPQRHQRGARSRDWPADHGRDVPRRGRRTGEAGGAVSRGGRASAPARPEPQHAGHLGERQCRADQ
jgi:tetratricopeptide (TPR) repeat protein/tRNA A-37 threonylcarbamoyl transferase component Bud32